MINLKINLWEFIGIALIVEMLILAVGCKKIDTHHDKDWVTFTVDSGEHYSNPSVFQIYAVNRIDSGCIKVLPTMYYDLNGYDQWNKISGYRFSEGAVNGVPKRTGIVAWRCITDSIISDTTLKDSSVIVRSIPYYHHEFAPYFNNYPDSLIVFPSEQDILRAEEGDVVKWVKQYEKPWCRIKIWHNTDTVYKVLNVGNHNPYYSVSFYFGGFYSAPNDIETQIKD